MPRHHKRKRTSIHDPQLAHPKNLSFRIHKSIHIPFFPHGTRSDSMQDRPSSILEILQDLLIALRRVPWRDLRTHRDLSDVGPRLARAHHIVKGVQ
ncbi:unnamed protein product [Periconia digitata]|uniref:Uncharacterized protein n=1 Tax=Periconia digitata TaxID=1303443 RepID=A0A9W4ULM6_9PLEO|nr:unnamed protein product [Periconia digitata]